MSTQESLKKVLKYVFPLMDVVMSPVTLLSSAWLYVTRRIGIQRLKLSRRIFMKIGVFPIIDHYYEPLFNQKHLTTPRRENRLLPGIDLNVEEQLDILSKFSFDEELEKFSLEKTTDLHFYYHNPSFGPGDAEYLYNIIRLFKPKRIVEIGSGYSTLIAINAITNNKKDNPDYSCSHICIEPYEMSWLEKVSVKVIRQKVENVDKSIFVNLDPNDVLFIDSSHMIRPQGDVLFEYLEILPILRAGVLVHIHDIFSPKDYPEAWLIDEVIFWNEQYLLEAFLSFNHEYRVIGALNYLKHNHFHELASKCPILKKEPDCEPGSFWMVKK